MLLKWIVCEVEEDQTETFHAAQVAWSQIRATVGLIAQLGGWSTTGHEACILAIWDDRPSYERFFRFVHDSVTYRQIQTRTYRRASIALGAGLIRMRGAAPTLADAAGESGFLRVADCQVQPARRNQFIDAQLRVWEPGMADCPGQLGGAFSVVEGTDDRFLVTTLWRDEDSHDGYVRDSQPGLKSQARCERRLHLM